MSKQPTQKPLGDQNFQKFAAQLVSPSEVFEPRAARNRVNIPESLELLGSLASLTRSSLVQTISPSGPLSASGSTNASLLNSGSASGSNSGSGSGATSENVAIANSVQYETSRKEYRQALEDQRISEALVKLHAHRENTQRARLSNSRTNTQSSHRSGAVIHQNQSGQNQQQTQKESRSGFQHASLPEVSVSAKPSPMRKSPGAYQTILRPFNPLNK